ncbi:MAG: metalloregulator ArsR/SmtB family transcription factor, partial [Halieaceae bacterium]|nr:metalloregulator ArsR/SmtB family transcription factor [Halieaceae bacterium]
MLDSHPMLESRTSTGLPAAAPANGQLSELANLCKASADPLRLQVLRVLREESFGVSELCAIFEIRQPALSHHLKVLAGAGLVATRREGNSIFYRRSSLGQRTAVEPLLSSIFECVDRIELPPATARRLAQLYRQREENSRNFFRDNAHKFRQQQDLIASYEQYADTVAQMLRDAPLVRRDTALEVGPGDGAFLLELAPLFRRVVALDNAELMLAQARSRAATAGLDNIEFVHGDTGSRELDGLGADCAVLNMVLHHTPEPGQILDDVASSLAPGGVVLVTDLCRHDQGWAREN